MSHAVSLLGIHKSDFRYTVEEERWGVGALQLFNLFLELICRFSEDESPEPSEEVRWEQLQILESLLKLYPDLVKIHRRTVLGNFNLSTSHICLFFLRRQVKMELQTLFKREGIRLILDLTRKRDMTILH
jgi:hypothetical protein